MNRNIGLHISIAGGLDKAIERAIEMNINTMQIFLKNSNRWFAPNFTAEQIYLFKEKWKPYKNLSISAHTGYLINLAGEGDNLKKSISLMSDEIIRSSKLGIRYIVLHPGSFKSGTAEEAILRIASNLDIAIENASSDVDILLETTAGQGSSIGHKFEHLRDIIASSRYPDRLGICLDTCHIYAAGYDISTALSYKSIIDDFNKKIGMNKLKLIHLNDSKKSCGSHVDRHEHIGKGFIGHKGLSYILKDKKFSSTDFILETPEDDICNARGNLDTVYSIINSA